MKRISIAPLIVSCCLASSALSAIGTGTSSNHAIVASATQDVVVIRNSNSVTTLSGQVFMSAKVSSVEPDGLTYTHSTGVTKVPFEDLPKEVQAQYGYSPAHARYYRSSRILTFTLFQDFADGTALVDDEDSGRTMYISPAPEQAKSSVFLGGGRRWRMRLYPAGQYTYTSKSGQDLVVPRYATSWIWADVLLRVGRNENATADYETKRELTRDWREEEERQHRILELQRQSLAAEQAAEAAAAEAAAKDRIADTLERQRRDEFFRSQTEQSELEKQTEEMRRQNQSLDDINWQLRQRQDPD